MENISHYLENVSLVTYVVVFISGLAGSFTPCIYPLIPIIMGVAGAGRKKSRMMNFLISVSYVLGMALMFSALGVAAALTGRLFGQVQSSPWAHLLLGNAMILFSLALLGVIPLPTFLLNRAGAGKVVKGGNMFAAFLMGLASGIVAAPCTAAILGAILAYVATTQNAVLGFSLLFTFATGLGAVLIVAGTFTGIAASIPRSEKIMGMVQKIFALLMLLLGEYYIFKAGVLSI
ncbi:MAG: cytochrome c biogenesis protein CcdA [Candidatus Omnitrophota bacterium]